MHWRAWSLGVIALLGSGELAAKTRLTAINATGFDSNVNNVQSPTDMGAANDTKILTGKQFKYNDKLSFGLNGSFSSFYRKTGSRADIQVWQLLPRVSGNTKWTPGILKSMDFKIGMEFNYSHKFNPHFKNNPQDDSTNVINNSGDDGSAGAGDHASGSTDSAQAAGSDAESADNDVDDDFEDPDFVGQGAGQSYATLKSFTRATYVNNYSSRLSFFITPFENWDLRFSTTGSYVDVGPQPGLLPASSWAHAYEISISREIAERLEIGFGYQIEFRKFYSRPATSGSTDLFFVRTHQVPLELSWKLGHHMRVTGSYVWFFREVPVHSSLNTIVHATYLEFIVNFNQHIGMSIWAGYALTPFTVIDSPAIERTLAGFAAIYAL